MTKSGRTTLKTALLGIGLIAAAIRPIPNSADLSLPCPEIVISFLPPVVD